ncbi:LapA family protein [Nitratireductor aquimarinus]|uniref:LapA family protein n=1 Tax=Alphaproteobacteria TaxID=28211 RepID=UPI000DE0C5B0|nr:MULTISPECIES: LapA family protein [Alphaproteobacteria]MBY6023199.1 LapA family protein [Nitratireductor sp. DP7N14-4]MBN7758406.1 LapA family protein [Nitratireductor aquimarinus]MBN7761708.1 LapA family protein [Nitratireductor aquibiodomus]MBN8243204.1 LapA family protein [Nitratireductor aquimarinus]MBY6001168.1 LapA family protein [Tritonibacter mobilis]
MANRIILVLVLVPLAVIIIALAVANRAAVPFTIDPFNPGNPALTIEWPLFVYLFAALGFGMIVGSLATWLRQGRYRRDARERKKEVDKLRQAPPASPNAPQIPQSPS